MESFDGHLIIAFGLNNALKGSGLNECTPVEEQFCIVYYFYNIYTPTMRLVLNSLSSLFIFSSYCTSQIKVFFTKSSI